MGAPRQMLDANGLVPGGEFAGHLVEAEVGRGGMGVVYRARHLALDVPRALKVVSPSLSSDPSYAERFRRECRLAASVEHPAVVAVHHAGEEDGLLYMSMQYVDGYDLGRLLAEGPLDPERALRYLDALGGGLDAAHDAGLIHRDVKPENVLIGESPSGESVFLTDFGIGILAEASGRPRSQATRGVVLGTSDYAAPEQISGDAVDSRADVYSLTCVAFHMLSGEPPFSGLSELAKLSAHGNGARPLASEVNPALAPSVDAVLMRGMAIDPAGRPARAGQLASALAAALRGESSTSTRELDAAVRPSRRFPRGWLIATIVGVLVLVGIALAVGIGSPDDRGAAGVVSPLAAASTMDAPRDPVDASAEDGLVWVAGRRSERVVALESDGHRAFGFGLELVYPRALVSGFGSIWVATWDGLVRIDRQTGDDDGSVPLGKTSDVAVDHDHVWVITREGQTRVVQVDPATLDVTGGGYVGDDARAVATGAGGVWVTNTADGTVSAIDAKTGRTVGRPLEVGGRPTNVAVGSGAVWVVDNFQGRLIRIDPNGPGGSPAVALSVSTDPHPRGVEVGFGSVWVSSGETDRVSRYDFSGELLGTYEVGSDPASVSIGDGSVWTADQAGDTVSRIDPRG